MEVNWCHLVHQSYRIFEEKQVVLSQANDITGAQLLLVSQHLPVPRDHGVPTRAEHGGRRNAAAKDVAVPRTNIGGKEKDIDL